MSQFVSNTTQNNNDINGVSDGRREVGLKEVRTRMECTIHRNSLWGVGELWVVLVALLTSGETTFVAQVVVDSVFEKYLNSLL